MDYSPRLLRHSHLTDHTRYPEGIHVNHPSSTHLVLRLRRVQGTRSRPADFHSPPEFSSPSTPPRLQASTTTQPTLATKSSAPTHSYADTPSSPHQALKEFWAALDGASPVPAAADRVRSALASFKENPARRTATPPGARCVQLRTSWTTPSRRS